MSAFAAPIAAVLQGADSLEELVAEQGATTVGVGLAVFAVLLIGVGVGASFIARAAEQRLLGPREAPPRVFLWTDLVIVIGLFVLGSLVASLAFQIADGSLGGDLEGGAVESSLEALEEGLKAAATGPDGAPPGDPPGPLDADSAADSAPDGAQDAGAAEGELGYVGTFVVTVAAFGLLAAYILIAGLARKGGAAALGLRPRVGAAFPGARPITAVSRYVATLPFIFAAATLLTVAYIGVEGGVPAQEVALDIAANIAAYPVFTVVMAVVLIPILEEVIFRGFLLELIAGRAGAWGGIVLSSLVFAALHGWPSVVPLLPLAIALGWVKVRSGSLYGPILIHMLHNGSQIAIAYHQST